MDVQLATARIPNTDSGSRPSIPARKRYLLQTLELTHDPFADPRAEQEIQTREKAPFFYDYLIDPPLPDSNKTLLEALHEANHALIWGERGTGKTTLRYMVDEDCRAYYQQTLSVTYDLSKRFPQPPDADTHWHALAEELAVDLFIQVVESLYAIRGVNDPTPKQKEHLSRQMALVWPRLERTIDVMLRDNLSDREKGLADFWPALHRPPIRYIEPTPKRLNLIKDCLPSAPAGTSHLSGRELLAAGLEAAAVWGFERIIILVDGVDGDIRPPETMPALIAPLLDALPTWPLKFPSFYFFLTPELENPLTEAFQNKFNALTTPPLSFKMKWERQTLQNLLHQRLRAAGSRAYGLGGLAAQDIAPTLDEALITAAQGSPRRLLQIVRALIDAHAAHNADGRYFERRDWELMRHQDRWPYRFPPPPPLP